MNLFNKTVNLFEIDDFVNEKLNFEIKPFSSLLEDKKKNGEDFTFWGVCNYCQSCDFNSFKNYSVEDKLNMTLQQDRGLEENWVGGSSNFKICTPPPYVKC